MRLGERGHTLVEVMVASVICVILLIGLGEAMTGALQLNLLREDQVIAFKASHQTLENLMALDMDTMLLQHGNTFTVGSSENPLSTTAATGTITITDLNWEGIADKAYLVKVAVPELATELSTVRTRY